MEIKRHGNNLNPHLSLGSPVNNSSAAGTRGGEGVEQSPQATARNLLAGLQGDADVRNRLLVEIQAKIHAGEYQTRAAAENAAGQILGL